MKAKETLESFFTKLKEKDVKYQEVKHLLTKTQQVDSLYIGRISVESHLNVLHSLVNSVKKITIKEKKVTDTVADMVATFYGKNKVKMQCRLVKETESRKPSSEGEWGINLNSFKLIKP